MFNKNRPRAKKSSPTPLWEHRLPVTALALSGKGGTTKLDKQLLKKHTLKPEIALLNQFPAQKALFKVTKFCKILHAGWIRSHVPIDWQGWVHGRQVLTRVGGWWGSMNHNFVWGGCRPVRVSLQPSHECHYFAILLLLESDTFPDLPRFLKLNE